jgi:SapC
VTPDAAPRSDLTFVSLNATELKHWYRLASFPWLDRIGVVPIADSEFLALSHFCPLAIEMHAAGPRPVAVLHSRLVAHRLLTDDGRWRAPYAPMGLRCLPFRNGAAMTADALEISPELAELGSDPKERLAMFGQKGGPTQPYATILSMADKIGRSSARLRNAAKLLMGADLLAPLAAVPPGPFGTLHGISAERMLALAPSRLMALTSDACCPLELATAISFSRRWLIKEARHSVEAAVPAPPGAAAGHSSDHAFVEPLEQPFALDDSVLFSFDDFVRQNASPS